MTQTSTTNPDVPVLGIDPGSRWTAGVVRLGDAALIGFTFGPVDSLGAPTPNGLDRINDWDAYFRYINRIVGAVRTLTGRVSDRFGGCSIAVRQVAIPSQRVRQAAMVRDWVIPQRIVSSLHQAFPDLTLTIPTPPPAGHGYPAELRGPRPTNWGPGEARRGDRSHERTAYDIAGAAQQPRR